LKQEQSNATESYLKFFHWPGATYLTASLFENIRQLLKHLKPLIDGKKTADNFPEQTCLSNTIKILSSNFKALSFCGIKLPEILEESSYQDFVKEYQSSIIYIIENEFSKDGSDMETCGSLWEDLYASCQDIMTFSI
jgi:hypothetical protein